MTKEAPRWDMLGRLRATAVMAGLLTAALSAPATAQTYDLLLKGGHVIDPDNEIDAVMDVAVEDGRIVKVAKDIPASRAKQVLDVSEFYVTPGLIDIHTHFDAQGASLNLQPDHHTLTNGVTTAVDAGSSGYKGFEKFKQTTIDHADTRVLAFLNVVGAGMYGPEVEDDPKQMDVEAAVKMVKKYPEIIVGIKTAHYEPADWEAVDRAREAAEESNTVMMVDFRPKPGRGYRELLLEHMRPGDIHTHMYSRRFDWLDENDKVKSYMWEARRRGILFDVGHGNGSFYFGKAVPALKQGFLPDTISTDIHKRSIMLPRANMTTTMSKFLNLGLTFEQVIDRTTLNPARLIRRTDLGTLTEGAEADIAVFRITKGKFGFLDSGLEKMIGDKKIFCAMTIRKGKIVWDTEGLSATEYTNAGPYTNFK
ncbi:MAG: amidohydrolase/deacetylase family metallohydrolase [Acidobacteria bacterium]|nr:amidohydrolase/deacetylase family metallohydrolase [Acidobacteriota bacterium]